MGQEIRLHDSSKEKEQIPSTASSSVSSLSSTTSKYRVNEVKEEYESSILSIFSLSLCDQNNSVICETGLKVTFLEKYNLFVETIMEETELAPLFDGEVWAGSMIWHAALHAVEYIYEQSIYDFIYNKTRTETESRKGNYREIESLENMHHSIDLIELGCGTGIPGLLCSLLGFNVCLTEQANLIPLLEKNTIKNLPLLLSNQHVFSGGSANEAKELETSHITIKEFTWDADKAYELVEERIKNDKKNNLDPTKNNRSGTFDLILCCDCVYEPLYGTSYLEMLKCISILGDDQTVILISVERRDKDGIENFINETSTYGRIECVARKNDNLYIYQIHLNPK